MSDPIEFEARPDPVSGCTVLKVAVDDQQGATFTVAEGTAAHTVTARRGSLPGALLTNCSACRFPACRHRDAVIALVNGNDQLRDWALHRDGPRVKSAKTKAPATARPTPPSPEAVATAHVDRWLNAVRDAAKVPEPPGTTSAKAARVLLFLWRSAPSGDTVAVDVWIAQARKHGGYTPQRRVNLDRAPTRSADRGLTTADLGLIAALRRHADDDSSTAELGPHATPLLRQLLDTGRSHWSRLDTPPLRAGERRRGEAAWTVQPTGDQAPAILVAGGGVPLWLDRPHYLDVAASEFGELELALSSEVAQAFCAGPALAPATVPALLQARGAQLTEMSLPSPRALAIVRRNAPPPRVHLALGSTELDRGWAKPPLTFDSATLTFHYGAHAVPQGTPATDLIEVDGEQVIHSSRDLASEGAASAALQAAGMVLAEDVLSSLFDRFTMYRARSLIRNWTLPATGDAAAKPWTRFVTEHLPRLREAGWQIDIDNSFRWGLATARSWFGTIAKVGADGWFDLSIGVDIAGERVDLLPVLLALLRGTGGELPPDLGAADGTAPALRLPDGRRVQVDPARLSQILRALVEMQVGGKVVEGKLRLRDAAAAQVADLGEHVDKLDWQQAPSLRKLAAKLQTFAKVEPVPAPAGLVAELRPYQLDGLAWLQFLRAHELGGILADDMGLGKTVQALAHLLTEKRAGRLDRPCLVVTPTSVVHNWANEAAKFTPMLRVLVLHGDQRGASFAKIADVDLVLTTYPLVHRDLDVLKAQPFHLLMLDEAQAIKNARAKVAKALRALDARHRLCLTGTPLENNLSELWAQLDFLMPGLLGDAAAFGRVFRGPIEKGNDGARRAALARKIRPFVLRRTKANVAAELPPKTEVPHAVELSAEQRDLYETIRLSVHERVRQTIAEKGIDKAQIIILDALLKLRQVCCDPRLVKLDSAKQVTTSAKLDALLELLTTLLADGRRVLLFSQFTSMLALIEPELDKRNVGYAKLTGDTKDRKQPIARFQTGAVPLFLISLKAGGTGLNLTAADTVIHYDPWWNPAAEQQATDRAHRIGQDKPVFVYKLIASGTVEEKIAALQERKRALAAGMLDGGERQGVALTKEDVDGLFAAIDE